MKNKIFKIRYIAAILSVFLMVVSCDTLLDQDETDFGKGPILVEFVKKSQTANIIVDGMVTYNVPIKLVGGDNQPISKPVDITISVDPSSTATSGTEFTLEKSTFTVMPGDMTVNVPLQVDTEKLKIEDPKTLVLKIDSSTVGISESNKTTIVLQAVCELDLNDFVGEFAADGTEGPATATIVLGSKPNSLLITNAEGSGTDQILIILNPDVSDPTITFVEGGEAVTFVSATYGNAWASTITPEDSSYNPCDISLQLKYETCVGAGCFAGETEITLVKK